MGKLLHISNWVDGVYTESTSKRIEITNPATEESIATTEATSRSTVESVVQTSLESFQHGPWSKADPSERFAVLSKAAVILRSRIPEFVDLEVQQTGRPIREMRAQLGRIPEWLEYFASLARTQEGSVTPFKGPVVNTLTRLPLGVVAQITPWNHPLLIATKKIGAALAAGNVVIVKPSELAPLSVLRLGSLFKEAGLPDGTLQIISGYGRDTGSFLCSSPQLAKIDLTGGLATYKAIAPSAATNLIPITAELGGKAPVCIFPSMDVTQAVKATLFASFIASGQTCVTGSRIVVHEDIWDSFIEALTHRTKALRIGDPTQATTQIGAVINPAAVTRCAAFVERALSPEQGGTLLCGGSATKASDRGYFFLPTLIATSPTSEIATTEIFGPVIALIKCDSEASIISVANSLPYALGASVWTNDFAQAHRVAEKIDAGIVWVNGHHLNDPSSPWGGFRESGAGKENGREAFESYTRVKSTIFNYGVGPTWFDEEEEAGKEKARYG